MRARLMYSCAVVLTSLLYALPAVCAATASNPSPLSIPVSQNWGSVSFSSMPSGFAAWNGISGGATSTQQSAEASTPGGDAVPLTSVPTTGGTGACYGYAAGGGDARFAILTSGNATNGVCQLAMAINTSGWHNIALAFDAINAVANARTVGCICQYRVGDSGAWTTVAGTGNPYVQSGGSADTVTPISLVLPVAAEDQPVVQIRWATWRGVEGGDSSGYAIDNISVTASSTGAPSISAVTLSAGSFLLGDPGSVTVELSTAPSPGNPATVGIASGAFAASPVEIIISNPATSGIANVTMATAGDWTATATAVSGCTGSAASASFTVTDQHTPVAYAGPDRTITLNGGPTTTLMTDATADDLGGLDGLTYAWTPLSGPGIVSWINASGSVVDITSPSDAEVTLSATGTYVFMLTVTDPGLLVATDTVAITVVPAVPPSDQYDPPSNYYDPARPGGVWLTGAALKTALTGIIDGHTVRSYDAAKQALQLLDRDPADASRIVLIYTGASVSKTWNSSVWNREHLWPDSLNGSGAPDSDLFNLRSCNPNVNSTRGNDPYGLGSGYWDPNRGASDRGNCARSMFYVATRYTNLTLVNGQPGSLQMGDLAKLLEWHYADPVENRERRRNHLIYSSLENPAYYQGNRNPYIDHPELVWTVFGGGANDSQLYLGTAASADGASTAAAAFQLIKGAPLPSQIVTLSKTGTAPTTYNVIAVGDATSVDAGAGQAFIGGTQTRGIGLSITSTATVGSRTGSIVIDNTDVSSGGPGRGVADGNDNITVTASVLEPANASFAAGADQNALTIDFGSVPVGRASNQPFAVYNLQPVPGFTAALDLDAIAAAGDTSRLTTNLATFSNLAAGASQGFAAALDTSTTGTRQAVYTLSVSDQNLPGAQAGTNLVLTLKGVVTPALTGDLNVDGYVDLTDLGILSACRTGPAIPYEPANLPAGCTATPDAQNHIPPDFDADGDVDHDDFGVLQAGYAAN